MLRISLNQAKFFSWGDLPDFLNRRVRPIMVAPTAANITTRSAPNPAEPAPSASMTPATSSPTAPGAIAVPEGSESCKINLELDVNTFGRDLQLATLGDLDSLHWAVTGGGRDVFNLLDNVVTLEDFAENDVAAVEP